MDVAPYVTRRRFLGLTAAAAAMLASQRARSEATSIERLADVPTDHALLPALKLVGESLDAISKFDGYEATFIKNELIGRKMLSSQMQIKVRHAPFSVYMKYIVPHAGREVIFVEGQNGGNLLAHETGFASLIGTLSLAPTDRKVMEENRYPITQFGMKKLAQEVFDHLLLDVKSTGVSVNLFPQSKIGEVACKTLEVNYATPTAVRTFQSARIYIETATSLPIRIQNYAFPARRNEQPALVEDYFYTAIKPNAQLLAADFDINNPKYGF
jgi:hypothetical protein